MSDSLEKIFASYKPEMGDSEKYMADLEKKLIVAEYFKRERRKLKISASIACIIGTIIGGIAVAFFLTHPIDVPDINFMNWFSENFHLVIAIVLGCSTIGVLIVSYLDKEEII